MKNFFTYILSMICLAMLLVSCSGTDKQDEQYACAAIYILPPLNFQVISQANNSDLFFGTPPVYAVADLKVYFKNNSNKIDSLFPVVKVEGTQKYFSFPIQRAQLKDTCIVKIKGQKADTLIYTTANNKSPCPQPYINTVAINKGAALPLADKAVIQVKK